MDALSAQMYGDPEVRVEEFGENATAIRDACIAIFNRELDLTEIVELIAPPDRSLLRATASTAHDSLELHVEYEWYGETNEYVVFKEGDRRIVSFENIHVKEDAPYQLETRIFARQVRSFQEFGIDEIRLFASGYPGGGYYVWPRLGFVMSTSGYGAKLVASGFADIDNTLELFGRDGGAKWWYDNGGEGEARFYLYKSSPCIAALEGYLSENEIEVYDDDNIDA
jgi:hypothetical protein